MANPCIQGRTSPKDPLLPQDQRTQALPAAEGDWRRGAPSPPAEALAKVADGGCEQIAGFGQRDLRCAQGSART